MDTPLFLKVVKRVGNNHIARQCGVSAQYVSKLCKEFEMGVRDKVPSNMVLLVCRADEWRATPHDIAPDLYPHPEDGLPFGMRCQSNKAA